MNTNKTKHSCKTLTTIISLFTGDADVLKNVVISCSEMSCNANVYLYPLCCTNPRLEAHATRQGSNSDETKIKDLNK